MTVFKLTILDQEVKDLEKGLNISDVVVSSKGVNEIEISGKKLFLKLEELDEEFIINKLTIK